MTGSDNSSAAGAQSIAASSDLQASHNISMDDRAFPMVQLQSKGSSQIEGEELYDSDDDVYGKRFEPDQLVDFR